MEVIFFLKKLYIFTTFFGVVVVSCYHFYTVFEPKRINATSMNKFVNKMGNGRGK